MGYRGILLLACCFAAPAFADVLPVDVIKLVVDPSTPATLYAAAGTSATDRGVYKSTDAGLTWTLVFLTADQPRDLEIDPLTPSTLYVSIAYATLPATLYKSTDGGVSWNRADDGIVDAPGVHQEDVVAEMAVDPVDEGVVYAASVNTGLYKSIDAGQSWTRINQGLSAYDPGVTLLLPGRLMVDPVTPADVYFAANVSGVPAVAGLYESTDGGATWNLTSLSDGVVVGLAMDPQDHLHLAACFEAAEEGSAVFESSVDGGVTWTSGATCGGLPSNSVAIDPAYPDHILVSDSDDSAHETIKPSTDGGATLGAATLSGVAVGSIVFDPEVASNVYAGTTASGLYISRDDGATWTPSGSAAGQILLVHVPADQATIQAGIDAAPDGDSVIVAPGTYQEQLDFQGKLITVKSSGGAAVTILDGNDTGPIVDFHSGESHAAVLQGFTLTHASNGPGAGSAILIAGASPSIEDDVFTANQENAGTGGAISGSQTSALLVRDYFTANTCGTGSTDAVVAFASDSSPIVAEDVFADNACVAYVQTMAAATASKVYNDTFVGNTEALRLLDYSETDTGAAFAQNIIAFNQVGVDTPSYTGAMPAFSYNLVYGDITSDYAGPTDTDLINLSADPMLVDWTHGDFHLLYTSPAIDAGYSSTYDSGPAPDVDTSDLVVSEATATDFYGQGRLFAAYFDPATVDIGAAEFHPPVIDAVAGTLQVLLDTPQTGTLLASGTDPAGPLFFSVVTPPAHGTLTLTDPTQETGGFRYVPAAGYLGPDSFTFEVVDPYAVVSPPATVSITVADPAATAHGGSVSTQPDTAVSGALSATQAYPSQQLSFAMVSKPTHGSVNLTAGSGQFKYTPVNGFIGADSFTFQVKDAFGTLSGVATESITVNDIAPKALAGGTTVARGRTGSGFLKATAAYAGQVLTYSVVTHPSHGTLTVNSATGAYTYVSAAHYAGTDSFTFKVTDQWGTVSNTAKFAIAVW